MLSLGSSVLVIVCSGFSVVCFLCLWIIWCQLKFLVFCLSVVSCDRVLLWIRSWFSVVLVDLFNVCFSRLFRCWCLVDSVLLINFCKVVQLGWIILCLLSQMISLVVMNFGVMLCCMVCVVCCLSCGRKVVDYGQQLNSLVICLCWVQCLCLVIVLGLNILLWKQWFSMKV